MYNLNLWNNLSILFSYIFQPKKTNHYFFHKLTLNTTLGAACGRSGEARGTLQADGAATGSALGGHM